MNRFPEKLQKRLDERISQNALRALKTIPDGVDFASNDYLGLGKSPEIYQQAHQMVQGLSGALNGSGGSRLLTGNYPFLEQLERQIAAFHKTESALLFNSGYDANVGFFSSVPQRNDVILYDELCHASIRDGIGLSWAKSYKFGHNDMEELEVLLEKFTSNDSSVYVVTESVFSMDGDSPRLEELVSIARKYNALLVIDEAHALGVFGEKGAGLVQHLGFESELFARIMTFGKGLGCHGAAVLGSEGLKSYLVNFSRSLIYTTAMPPHNAATIASAYQYLSTKPKAQEKLSANIAHFNQEKMRLGLRPLFVYSKSAIQCAIIPGNGQAREVAKKLQDSGFDVRAILSPTVPGGQERLRFCLHAYNSEDEISQVLQALVDAIF